MENMTQNWGKKGSNMTDAFIGHIGQGQLFLLCHHPSLKNWVMSDRQAPH